MLIIASVLTLLALVSANEQSEGICIGIGWGCEPEATTVVALVAIFLVPLATIILVFGHVIIWAIRTSPHRRRESSSTDLSTAPRHHGD